MSRVFSHPEWTAQLIWIYRFENWNNWIIIFFLFRLIPTWAAIQQRTLKCNFIWHIKYTYRCQIYKNKTRFCAISREFDPFWMCNKNKFRALFASNWYLFRIQWLNTTSIAINLFSILILHTSRLIYAPLIVHEVYWFKALATHNFSG